MIKMRKKVVLLAPHLDDIELAIGGFVAKLSEQKAEITYIGFYAPPFLREEHKASAEILGISKSILLDFENRTFPKHRQEILQILYDYDKSHKVHLVLTPARSDIHQDHQTITNEAIRAFRKSTILGYQVPGNNIEIKKNCLVMLTARQIKKKAEAILCYKSQSHRGPQFKPEYTFSRSLNQDVHLDTTYIEMLEVIKLVII